MVGPGIIHARADRHRITNEVHRINRAVYDFTSKLGDDRVGVSIKMALNYNIG